MALNLGHLDGVIGFRLDGVDAYDCSGVSVAGAGDVNGDGFSDLIVGAFGADVDGTRDAGKSYVVFGTGTGFPASLDLAALDGSNGFRLDGIDAYDHSGFSVAGAGDVNGDGFDDLIVGAAGADVGGESYVVFGTDTGFAASLDLAALDGSNGFRLDGIDVYDVSGDSVAGAGDVNGDGVDDLIIGAPGADLGGESYVVFGTDAGFAASLDLGDLDGSNGFRLDGASDYASSGSEVAGAGDVNGDGIGDLIIGAPGPGYYGDSYVVFGTDTGFAASLDLADLDGSNGFRLEGVTSREESAYLVAGAGDFNGDGIGDLIIGAPGHTYFGLSGDSYVVFGTDTGFAANVVLADLDGSNGFRLGGDRFDTRSVSGAGDVNGDGFDDLIVGGWDGYGQGAGYIVFGTDAGFAASLDLDDLDSSAGVRIDGIGLDQSGFSVAGAGDVNGDGFDDLIVGARDGDPNGASDAGESYLIFGSAELGGANDAPLAAPDLLDVGTLDRVDLAADNGSGADRDPDFDDLAIVTINGSAVAPGDTVILASGLRVTFVGATEVLFDAPGVALATVLSESFVYQVSDGHGGTASATTATVHFTQSALSFADLDGSNGFRLDGVEEYDSSGLSVAGAGDVNGDGVDDLIIGAFDASPDGTDETGASYIVFGTEAGFTANLDLAALDGSNGFRLDGIDRGDSSGRSVAGAGDVNGDGFDDVIIGAPRARPDGPYSYDIGESYVVFGSDGGFPASLDLASLDGSNGFRLEGVGEYGFSGYSVAGAGDVNGDGIDDLIIGAPSIIARDAAGQSYVVFGTDGGFAASLELAALDGSNGFRIDGIDPDDNSGLSVAAAGDVNGDGIDDLIVGAPGADPGGESHAGESFVVFGSATGFAASLDLADLDGSNGFRLDGIDAYDESGRSVAGAGDVNGDGFDDLIVGAGYGNPETRALESYVVFGGDGGFSASVDLADLDGSNGFRLDGDDAYDYSGFSVAGAGDVNGDGFDDLIVGAWAAPNDDYTTGASYVVFGTDAGFAASLELSDLDGSNGFRLDGIDMYDESGRSVAGAGDVNGDGFDDLIVGAPGAAYGAGESYVIFGFATDEPLAPIFGTAGRDVLAGSEADESFHPGGGFDFVTTGGGSDTVFFDDLVGTRDVLTIADFDPLADTLDLRGATVAQTYESDTRTVLLLDGPDRDTVVLLGLADSPLDLI